MMKVARPIILLFTTSTGGGHMNIAQSLKEILEVKYDVAIMNPQSVAVDRWYTFVSRHFLQFLEWQFIFTDNRIVSFCFQRILTLLSRRRFQCIIERIQPQLIITTHALLSYVAARANERRRERVPLIFQLTDLGQLHMTWFTEKQAAAYFAPTQEIFTQAQEQGIDKSRLYLTGRPVRCQFLEVLPGERSETLAALDFDPAIFTIFLQGGAKGSAGVDRTISCLLSTGVPVQIILAAGNNKEMAERYVDNKRVRILPFTGLIAPYMAAADVIAGKAGASFISEAFMLEKPFLVTAFIPGQETPNLRFVERHNLGWVCLQTAAQQELLTRLTSNPEMIAEKVESIRAYKAWNRQANRDILSIIDRLLHEEMLVGYQESV